MFEEGARDEDPTRDSTIAPLHSTTSVRNSPLAKWRRPPPPIVGLDCGVAFRGCIGVHCHTVDFLKNGIWIQMERIGAPRCRQLDDAR